MTGRSGLLPYFSIIIPTYHRPQKLNECLAGLAALDYPRDRYEAIVVDDGGSDVPPSMVEQFLPRMTLQLLRTPHRGPAAARNAGAEKAAGDYLVFTDDDCVPHSYWLGAFAHRVSPTSRALLGGKTQNALPDNPYSTASQLLIDYLYDYYHRARPSRPGRFFTSNNMAVSAEAFRTAGGFDDSFTGAAAEDREFCDRWIHQGRELQFVPEAILFHAHALSLRAFWRQHLRYGRAAHRFHRLHAARYGQRMNLEPLSFYFNLARFPYHSPTPRRRALLTTLLVLSQISNASGYCIESTRTHLRGMPPRPTTGATS